MSFVLLKGKQIKIATYQNIHSPYFYSYDLVPTKISDTNYKEFEFEDKDFSTVVPIDKKKKITG